MTATLPTMVGMAVRDHELALRAGFDIEAVGRWVRPDSAELRRVDFHQYFARRSDGNMAYFCTMREAVEWIGGTRRCRKPEHQHDD